MKKTILTIIGIVCLLGAFTYYLTTKDSYAQVGDKVMWRTDQFNGGNRYSIVFRCDTAQTISLPPLDISEFDDQSLIYYGISTSANTAGSSDSVTFAKVEGVHIFQNYATGTITTIYDTLALNSAASHTLGSNKLKYYQDTLNTYLGVKWSVRTTPLLRFTFFGRAIDQGIVKLDIYCNGMDALPTRPNNVSYGH
jgi:hypothetical protein